jgi:homeobox-leucine zipper protein
VKMADTLLANYVGGIAGIPAEAWSIQCSQGMEQDVIKIMYNRKDDRTNTAIVCTSASFMLPVPMRRAFDLLKNNILRQGTLLIRKMVSIIS